MLGDLYHRRQRYGNLQPAIRNGAFDYILKPVSWKRLSQSLERFIQFYDQQRSGKSSISKTSIPLSTAGEELSRG